MGNMITHLLFGCSADPAAYVTTPFDLGVAASSIAFESPDTLVAHLAEGSSYPPPGDAVRVHLDTGEQETLATDVIGIAVLGDTGDVLTMGSDGRVVRIGADGSEESLLPPVPDLLTWAASPDGSVVAYETFPTDDLVVHPVGGTARGVLDAENAPLDAYPILFDGSGQRLLINDADDLDQYWVLDLESNVTNDGGRIEGFDLLLDTGRAADGTLRLLVDVGSGNAKIPDVMRIVEPPNGVVYELEMEQDALLGAAFVPGDDSVLTIELRKGCYDRCDLPYALVLYEDGADRPEVLAAGAVNDLAAAFAASPDGQRVARAIPNGLEVLYLP